MNHEHWMQRCLDLAQQGAGRVSPNPMVGCVIVAEDDTVLGEGFHGAFGGPHAEVQAIRHAEDQGFADRLEEATLYVNLEPCGHHGQTPPCSNLIVATHIPRVVVAMEDPNPRVSGSGLAKLRDAAVQVTFGVMEKEAKRLNEAFSQHVTTGRPLVKLKIAQTKDGMVAGPGGAPQAITSTESNRLVHRWRSEVDAVMVGSGTAATDDPRLTVRLVDGRQPLRIVLDRKGELLSSLALFSDEYASETTSIVGEGADPTYTEAFTAKGGRIIKAPTQAGHLDLEAVFRMLGAGEGLSRPVQSILVEAGPSLATSLIQQDLVDRLFIFTSPQTLGMGTSGLSPGVVEQLDFKAADRETIGPDKLFRGYLRAL